MAQSEKHVTLELEVVSSSPLLGVEISRILFFLKFIYLRKRERECMREKGRGREREREDPRQVLHCQHRAQCGA